MSVVVIWGASSVGAARLLVEEDWRGMSRFLLAGWEVEELGVDIVVGWEVRLWSWEEGEG